MKPGDEMMIWCTGGRASLKRELFPPRLEIEEDGGIYVLHDDGDPTGWRYVFLSTSETR